MNKLDYKNMKVIDKFHEPYPLIIYSNLLNNHQLNDLEKCMSNNSIFDKIVMGNRKTILKGTKNFSKFIQENYIANEINSFFDDNSVFNFFYKNLSDLNKYNSKYFDFENKNFKLTKNFISRKNDVFFKIKNRSSKILSKLVNNHRIYCDFDFSVAGSGYEREPHHDKEGRILNFLFYINNFDAKKGGSFQVFKYINNPIKYLRQPSLEDIEVIKKIEPQRGYLITFLSTPNSIHSVDTITSTNNKRYFFYGSYTSISKIIWSTSD